MKKYRKIKILSSIFTILGLSVISLGSCLAWGPERPTFTMAEPATYPVFNSITDNPTIGDERNFVRIGEVSDKITLKNEVEIVPGKQYLVYIYFHNNASATFNDSAHNNSGVAVTTRLSSSFSTIVTAGDKGSVTATITANNTNPLSVWDEAYMTTNSDKVYLRYVVGSSRILNDWNTNGSVMPSSLFTEEGALLGLNALNGVIPGCEEYHGVVTYILQAEALGGSVSKTVSKDGVNYGEGINLKAGEEAYFQIAIQNTGDMALTNATIKDILPEGLTLVSGSVRLRANESTTLDELSDNIVGDGYNLGTIGTGNTVYITYRAVAGDDFDCQGKNLENKVTLTYDNETSSGETKNDSAIVNVRKDDCVEEIPSLDTCENNPALEGCDEKKPEGETPSELPETGPLEIIMAIVIVLCIGGGGYYFYRTRRALTKVEKTVKGDQDNSSQKPNNMVK